MLKIVKGLKISVKECISTYIDDMGNEYVRVKADDEDFCIALHDCVKNSKRKFSWNNAMKALEADGLTTFTNKQVLLYIAHRDEINNKFKEMDCYALISDWYWTSSIYSGGSGTSWIYQGVSGETDYSFHYIGCRIRPIFNLK